MEEQLWKIALNKITVGCIEIVIILKISTVEIKLIG
jgi:hypothetical protein